MLVDKKLLISFNYFQVRVSRQQCVLSKVPALDYGRTAECTFMNGPKSVRERAGLAKFIVNFFLCATYFGLSSVYAVLIGNQTKQVCSPVLEAVQVFRKHLKPSDA